ncbi:MAG: hypothetical protein FJX68_06005 [Alphaproteobacteria bacterium]|nr:hypothetical protein [Alphaproteobacteria bacterium]
MTPSAPRRRLVDAALAEADRVGWRNLSLFAVARRAGLPLADAAREFADLDAVGEAWLARADQAMLALAEQEGFAEVSARERVERALTTWLAALRGRRRVLGDMLAYKLRPAHVHLHAALVVGLSRRVQWLRQAALLPAGGAQRDFEEVGLTLLFVAAVSRWLAEDADDFPATRQWLARRLASAEWLMRGLFVR